MSDPKTSSLDELRVGLGSGDQDSARELFTRFATRLVSLARSRMDTQLKHMDDLGGDHIAEMWPSG